MAIHLCDFLALFLYIIVLQQLVEMSIIAAVAQAA